MFSLIIVDGPFQRMSKVSPPHLGGRDTAFHLQHEVVTSRHIRGYHGQVLVFSRLSIFSLVFSRVSPTPDRSELVLPCYSSISLLLALASRLET